jgi:hypothetical protein
MDKEQTIKLAKDLVGDGNNGEYTRGVAELLAYMYPEANTLPSDNVEHIIKELVN